MRHLTTLVALCLAVVVMLAPQSAAADRRVALVIGNSNYKQVPTLDNPANDAADLAAKLGAIGFDVLRGTDLDYAGMRDIIRRFGDKLNGADVALMFYAGHGLQVAGKNYLVPVDARISNQSDVDLATIDLDVILRAMEADQRTNIVFLDACRDNPFAQKLAANMGTRSASVGRGLAQAQAGVGTLIAYSTQPGNVALDGQGRNSPFTSALLKTIDTPGLSLGDTMIAVRNDVLQATNGQQVPWDHSSLTGQFYFVPPAPGQGGPGDAQAKLEIAFWNSIKDSKNPQLFDAYLKRYPNGTFADIAKIDRDQFKVATARPIDEPGAVGADQRPRHARRTARPSLRAQLRSGFADRPQRIAQCDPRFPAAKQPAADRRADRRPARSLARDRRAEAVGHDRVFLTRGRQLGHVVGPYLAQGRRGRRPQEVRYRAMRRGTQLLRHQLRRLRLFRYQVVDRPARPAAKGQGRRA